MIISILIFCFIFQMVISNFISGIYLPLFVIPGLIVIYPYFKDNIKYLIICFIYGIFYDIFISSYTLINTFLFLFIGTLITVLNRQWNNNVINNIIFFIILDIVYQTVYYFIISIIDKVSWLSQLNLNFIINTMISNIIFISILYIVTDKLSKKYKIYKID